MQHRVKGAGILVLRKLIQNRGPEFERIFSENLPPATRKTWENPPLAFSWVPVDFADEGNLLYVAARALFPGEFKQALYELGRVMAGEGLPRYYNIFIRIPTPQFVFKRVAQLWRLFYSTGDARMENVGSDHACFMLCNYPEYPSNMREYLSGYLLGVGEMIGLKDIKVLQVGNNPQAWRWDLTWTSANSLPANPDD